MDLQEKEEEGQRKIKQVHFAKHITWHSSGRFKEKVWGCDADRKVAEKISTGQQKKAFSSASSPQPGFIRYATENNEFTTVILSDLVH